MPNAQGKSTAGLLVQTSIVQFDQHKWKAPQMQDVQTVQVTQRYQPLNRLQTVLQWDVEHDCSARGLGAELPRAAFGRSFGLKQMTHWNYPSPLPQGFRLPCFYFYLFIHVFKRGRFFSAHEKPVPSRTENSLKRCWQAPGISLALPKHPRLSWQ